MILILTNLKIIGQLKMEFIMHTKKYAKIEKKEY